MIKLAIADDEVMIREGLAELFNWQELGIEVVGLAKNGNEMVELAREKKPDLCLVDICMPIINGLELIEKVREMNKNALFIVVTGYSEFSYAHRAIQLDVFDYIIKPIDERNLLETILRARDTLTNEKEQQDKLAVIEKQMQGNLGEMQQRLINGLVRNLIPMGEIKKQLVFLKLTFAATVGMVILKHIGSNDATMQWPDRLLYFAYKNILSDFLKEIGTTYCVTQDYEDHIFAIVSIENKQNWDELISALPNAVQKCIGQSVDLYHAVLFGGIETAAQVYNDLCAQCETNYSLLISDAKKIIELTYAKDDFSLNEVAKKLNVCTSHLSRQFKKEMRVSFLDYLIQVRINKALELMKNTSLRINEIAEQVGYKNQHYFAFAFKKIMALTPSDYRKKYY